MQDDREKIINIEPNHTQIPNYYLDKIMAFVSDAEWKCLSYIARRTFGFQKQSDRIALSQFCEGIIDKDGKILDYGTGLSKPTVVKSLENLFSLGIIEKTPYGQTFEYELVKNFNQLELVKNFNTTGKEFLPELVKEFNIQKKGNKVIKKKIKKSL